MLYKHLGWQFCRFLFIFCFWFVVVFLYAKMLSYGTYISPSDFLLYSISNNCKNLKQERLKKGISQKTVHCIVYVIINKLSFESFMCLDLKELYAKSANCLQLI